MEHNNLKVTINGANQAISDEELYALARKSAKMTGLEIEWDTEHDEIVLRDKNNKTQRMKFDFLRQL